MLFRVLTGAGLGHNAGAGGNNNARDMQTLSERRSVLSSLPYEYQQADEDSMYEYVMSMPPGPDREVALLELANERSKPQYWYGEDKPRDPILTSSSSWVHDIQYDPSTEELSMDGYTVYGVTPEDAAKVLRGRYLSGNGSVGRSLINLWRTKGFGINNQLHPEPL